MSAQIVEALALVAWALLVIAGVVLILWLFWRTKKVTGTLIVAGVDEYTTGKLVVTGSARIEASSQDFFVIRDLDSGQVLPTKPGEIPPASKYPAYFAVTGELGEGRWLVEGDKVVIKVEAGQEAVLEFIPKLTSDYVGVTAALFVAGVVIWLLGYFFVHWLIGLAIAQHFLK